MISISDKALCCGCQACFNVCPQSCILFKTDDEGFFYPFVETSKCIDCGLCEKVCPFLLKTPIKNKKPRAFAAKNRDFSIRKASSSGGIFTALAEMVLLAGGTVYGCSMVDDGEDCCHLRVDTKEDLWRLRGSKYFQSSIGKTYTMVREDLLLGKKVLFSGVPCQIIALKLFLRKDYDNLFLVEIMCHGVPSSKLWRCYCDYLKKSRDSILENVSFRDKKNGWHRFGLSYSLDGVRYYKTVDNDPYMRMFLRNYCLRPSCYNCNAKRIESMADLTIADFWGVERVVPAFDDDFGTSLVFVQNEKGQKLFESLQVEKSIVSYDSAIKYNPPYTNSPDKPALRDSFYKDLDGIDFEKMVKKYAKDRHESPFAVAKRVLGRLYRKIFKR